MSTECWTCDDADHWNKPIETKNISSKEMPSKSWLLNTPFEDHHPISQLRIAKIEDTRHGAQMLTIMQWLLHGFVCYFASTNQGQARQLQRFWAMPNMTTNCKLYAERLGNSLMTQVVEPDQFRSMGFSEFTAPFDQSWCSNIMTNHDNNQNMEVS